MHPRKRLMFKRRDAARREALLEQEKAQNVTEKVIVKPEEEVVETLKVEVKEAKAETVAKPTKTVKKAQTNTKPSLKSDTTKKTDTKKATKPQKTIKTKTVKKTS